MSLWTKLWAASNPTAFDPGGILMGSAAPTVSGVSVGPDSALKLSVVYACVRLLSETIAALPLVVYQRRADGGREEATQHPLYELLHDQPNANQTAIEFRQMMTAHALLRGNAYARIVPGPRGPADQLIPLHPDHVTPEELPDGNLRYRVSGLTRPLLDDEVLHLKGMSLDGKMGVSVITYMRESIGLGLAAEHYGGRFFGNGAQPGGVLKKTDGKSLSDGAAKRVKASWESAHVGGNQHRVAVLEEGLEFQAIGINNKDSQFIELREFQAEDIAGRWFGVPPHMIGLTSKATTWGSGIEQMGIGFVVYTLLPWLKRWEQAISRDLIIATDRYFVEHVVAGLLRGDTQARYAAYAIGRQWGWLSVNDIRHFENMNPISGGETYLTPLNMSPAAELNPATAPTLELPNAHYRLLIHESAARVVRKEFAAIAHLSKRAQSHSDLDIDIKNFYAGHADFVAQTLRISERAARQWCDRQSTRPGALDESESTAALVALVESETR